MFAGRFLVRHDPHASNARVLQRVRRALRLVREGGSSYFLRLTKTDLKDPPVTFPGALGRPPHRSAAHQRTSIHEQTVDKARPPNNTLNTQSRAQQTHSRSRSLRAHPHSADPPSVIFSSMKSVVSLPYQRDSRRVGGQTRSLSQSAWWRPLR
eukprot:scaffold2630_cov57-Phaeocystis_antarctica.AAC.2